MSTQVIYKDNVIGSINTGVLTLETDDKWIEDNVVLVNDDGGENGHIYQDEDNFIVLDNREDIEVAPKYITQNGHYSSQHGKVYNPVYVDVDLTKELVERTLPVLTPDMLDGMTTIGDYAFYGFGNLKDVVLPDSITTLGRNAFSNSDLISFTANGVTTSTGESLFSGCNYLEKVHIPNLGSFTSINSYVSNCFRLKDYYVPKMEHIGTATFNQCDSLEYIAMPMVTTIYSSGFVGCESLKAVDFGSVPSFIRGDVFKDCTSLDTIILRATSLSSLGNINNIANNTPFSDGGSGGTIYIPKALYDELGTGSSLDYKAASNWSTIDAYGTITWAKIEGSKYENYYADGRGVLQDITQNLTNCSITNDLAHYHTAYKTEIVPDSGYTTISNVTVTMDDVNITDAVYDSTSHIISIDLPEGEIEITATGGVS